jgi:hypothetical protein
MVYSTKINQFNPTKGMGENVSLGNLINGKGDQVI